MLFPGRLSELPPAAFAKLATLLDPHKPGMPVISLAVGDPNGAVPPFVTEALEKHAKDFGQYPPINGTADWRQAAAGWLMSRFGLAPASIDPEKNVLPLNGTREGLFLALFTVMPETKAGKRPAVLLPNPFYQCYAAAALASGGEPVFVPAMAETGFLPDFASLPRETLERTAAVYICSPSNPEGACASEQYWRTLFALADQYDFTVFADECYADIYLETPPVSALPVRGAPYDRLLTFHSLSKRSGLPGLRSGIVAGEAKLMERFRQFRNYAGPQVPLPIIAASAAAWRDEAHVEANRAGYQEKFRLAQRMLGNRAGFRLPEGGFFLWLDVGNGEETALRLWREVGVRTLPGAYMGREVIAGNSRSNPGFSYLRVALVNDLSTITAALERMTEILGRS
ncbi:MAG: aminotransferase class I/II-fold pyridoxal phosphate-dependent enzyme [Alphaproteobacteria bacterium]|nr:aminotransferase class I/II-fold pyridoxal phosphate-dependent enzyme [Alphaproteobacteria bacterium]MBL6937498.1 aminotransferase class I/II-fold pyridoxal phosphate-dependent enzyme [Alphaproteobacteria bacterium]MBL7098836.1 aminotransferase class I/II-fold pyridoxal phosphate-dependent enzyme [Alphaproteobacteria bacterium]